ncbi:MAG: adenylate/guanylate cyclase domain-containing protein [Nitrospirae bacterium]|nr:adenylate/guanylate cyclase domain-containing protein [Nitrospirota bacterium]
MTAQYIAELIKGKAFKTLAAVLAIGTAVSLAAALLGMLGTFDRLEDTALVVSFLKRPPLQLDPAITSIDIDDEALKTLGRWPWPHERHESLIRLLKLYQSRAIIFTDIDMPKAAHNSMEEKAAWDLKEIIKDSYLSGGAAKTMPYLDNGDGSFYKTLKDYGWAFYTIKITVPNLNGHIISNPKLAESHFASLTEEQRLLLQSLKEKIAIPGHSHKIPSAAEISLPSKDIVEAIKGGGFNTIVMDKEGIVLRYPLITRYNNTLYLSLALDAAIKLLNADNVTVTPGKSVEIEHSVGRISIPIDKDGQTPVNWAGSYKDTFPRIPYGIAASMILFQEAKNELRKYGLRKMPDTVIAQRQLINDLKKHRYASNDQITHTADSIYIATLLEAQLNSGKLSVKEALKAIGITDGTRLWIQIGNQIRFNNYLLLKYDEDGKMPLYEDAVTALGYSPDEAEDAALKDSYALVIFHLETETIPLVRPLYFGKWEITQDGRARRISPLDLKDKIVFYGLTSTGLTSQNPTPFMKRHPMLDLPINVLNSILAGKFLHELSPATGYLITFALAYFIVLIVLMAAPVRSGAAAVLAVAAYFALSWYLFRSRGIIMPVSQPLFAIGGAYLGSGLYRYFQERKERGRVRRMFSTMVSPDVLKLLEKTSGTLNLGGERREATMFSSDVSGFTAISEGVTSRELADILNVYLTPMSNIIMCYDGYVDKYEGDAIKADFGVPLSDPGHAWKACWAALYQQEELLAVQRMILLRYGVKITARMGINTGVVLAGNMGSDRHIQYTAMGPAAAVAEELEPANKLFDTWIMIGHDTYEKAKDYIYARHLGQLRTHHGTESVYELAGWNSEQYLSYWEHRPIPELIIKSLKRLRPEKILGYNYYLKNKPLPDLPILTKMRGIFSELAELSIQYMQIQDTINLILTEHNIDELIRALKPYEAIYEKEETPEKIRNELQGLRSAISNETIPYKAALLGWQIDLKQLYAQITTLAGKVDKAAYEHFYDMSDKLEKGIESINKRINYTAAGDTTAEALSENLKALLLIEDLKGTQNVDKLTHQCLSIERVISVRLNKFAEWLRKDPRQYHRLIADMCTVSKGRIDMFGTFDKGLQLFRKRQWDGALDTFRQCLASVPNDGPSKTYIAEIERLMENPPKEDWTGAWESG